MSDKQYTLTPAHTKFDAEINDGEGQSRSFDIRIDATGEVSICDHNGSPGKVTLNSASAGLLQSFAELLVGLVEVVDQQRYFTAGSEEELSADERRERNIKLFGRP